MTHTHTHTHTQSVKAGVCWPFHSVASSLCALPRGRHRRNVPTPPAAVLLSKSCTQRGQRKRHRPCVVAIARLWLVVVVVVVVVVVAERRSTSDLVGCATATEAAPSRSAPFSASSTWRLPAAHLSNSPQVRTEPSNGVKAECCAFVSVANDRPPRWPFSAGTVRRRTAVAGDGRFRPVVLLVGHSGGDLSANAISFSSLIDLAVESLKGLRLAGAPISASRRGFRTCARPPRRGDAASFSFLFGSSRRRRRRRHR